MDASWHLGASQGQYADARSVPGPDVPVDPYGHSTWKASSYGLASRSTTRALVVEDSEGKRVAIITHDLYLPQDLLTRRVAGLLQQHDRDVSLGLIDGAYVGITPENLAVTASHSHSSPYYSSPSWGLWVFEDVFDVRFFEYMAQKMSQAVIEASGNLVPVRVGGATVPFNEISSHSYGPQVGDDGTPAGQPWSFTAGRITVVSFDDLSDPGSPRPLATWLIMGLHPEWVFGDGLLNGDITHALYRVTDREIGGVTLWSQRETGTSGPHKDTRVHPPEARREFQDMKFGQLERAARLLADRVAQTRANIERWSRGEGSAEMPNLFAPLREDFEVAAVSVRVAPPTTRPYPGVSNCNTARAFRGDPGVPVAGLPDCEFPFGDATHPVMDASPVDLSTLYDEARAAGVPIPSSYGATAFTGVEETIAVHLQAMRLGDIGITFAPAEQFTDQVLNIESRLDLIEDNLWEGWDWTTVQPCTQGADTRWTCPDPRKPQTSLPPVTDVAYRTMRAQIHNDADGWDDPEYAPYADSEPVDPAQIKGNFTREELAENGFRLPIAVGMANDYWGYIPSYREYRSHDHYRKALSGLGPHGSDFLATRLARMAASLNGGDDLALSPLDLAYQAEGVRADLLAQHLGELSAAFTAAYEASLPADGGVVGVVEQPIDVRRFDAASVRWIGGSSYDDLPNVRVERLVDNRWEQWGDQTGEVQVMVDSPVPAELPAWRAGEFAWTWTASFEAFVSDLERPGGRPGVTPEGAYRFVIDGVRRSGAPSRVEPYHLESESFRVRPWAGITVEDLRVEPGGDVSFRVGPVGTHAFGTPNTYVVGPVDYPDSYESRFPFIRNERRLFTYGLADPARHQQYCPQCSFRPWADTAAVASATVTVARADGVSESVPAEFDPETGWWVAHAELSPGERASVEPGGIVDTYGETNGQRVEVVG